jgi:hypothetical protein
MTLTKWSRSHVNGALTNILHPFSDLESPGQSLKALLLKFARCSTDGAGNKVYNSKRPLN